MATRVIMMCMFICLFMCACTDAEWERSTALASEAHITCYSGGVAVYDGHSTGKVEWLEGGGAYWKDKETGRLVETFADCIFKL